MPSRIQAKAATPLFFLDAVPTDPAGPAVPLSAEEAQHARVLRLGVGDACVGLDGHGHRWPMVVSAGQGSELALTPTGEPDVEPEPGRAGASLPWIELAVSWPRKTRAEPMIGTLVQLGAAAITALDARHRGGEPCPDRPPPRWTKLAREALKQCGRSWMPAFEAGLAPLQLLEDRPDATIAFLDPKGGMSFDTWLRSLRPGPDSVGARARPIVIVVGPEGGFATDERTALLEAGATSVWLGPHVQRIETAAAAAMAIAGCTLGAPPSPHR